MSRTSTLPKHLQPMLATLTDAPFDDPGWVFEDKYDGFRMIAAIESGKVTLYSRNGIIISRSYIEVATALEGVKHDAVIDGELVAIGKDGVSHFQLLQNALRHEAKLLYCAFDLMFEKGVDLRKQSLLERKKTSQNHFAAPPADRVQLSPQSGRYDVLRGSRAKGIGRYHGEARGQRVRLRKPNRRLAKDQDSKATGSRDRRLHSAQTHQAVLRRPCSRGELVRIDVGEGPFALTDAGRHDPEVVFVDEPVIQQRFVQLRDAVFQDVTADLTWRALWPRRP
jgi:ATP dependent DNA ligase domain